MSQKIQDEESKAEDTVMECVTEHEENMNNLNPEVESNIQTISHPWKMSIHEIDEFGNNKILNLAMKGGTKAEFAWLIDNGVNWDDRNHNGDTALHVSVRAENLEAVHYFLSLGAKTKSENNQGVTPIMEAAISAKKHFGTILETFFEHDSKSSSESLEISDNVEVFVNLANGRSSEEVHYIKYLHIRFPEGESILHLAANSKNILAVNYLIQNGVEPDIKCNNGVTPLVNAVRSESLEVINLLKIAGANMNAVDNEGLSILHHAVLLHKPTYILKQLCELGSNVDVKDKRGAGLLHFAAQTINVHAMHFFICAGVDRDAKCNDGFTPLMYVALYSGEKWWNMKTPLVVNRECTKLLNENFDRINYAAVVFHQSEKTLRSILAYKRTCSKQTNNSGESILHLAAEAGNLPACKSLIFYGANVNRRTTDGSTPLLYVPAASNNFIELVDLFIKHKADINAQNKVGNNVIAKSALFGRSKEDILELVKRGAILKLSNKDDDTLLHLVVRGGNVDAFKYLCSPDISTLRLKTCKEICSLKKIRWPFRKKNCDCPTIESEITSTNASPKQIRNEYVLLGDRSPKRRHLSEKKILRQAHDVFTLFLLKGADVNKANNYGQTPLHITVARRYDFIDWVKFLVQKNADINAADKNGDTLLCYAITKGKSLSELKELIELGADWKIKTNDLETVLHLAANVDNLEPAEYFISIGADVEARDKFGGTALLQASCSDSYFIPMIDLFMGNKADFNATDDDRENLIFKAVKNCRSVDIISQLVSKGIKWNFRNRIGDFILHTAVKFGNIESLTYFISQGADLNARNIVGYTPLLLTAFGNAEMFKLLVKCLSDKGANINSTDLQFNNLIFVAAYHGKSREELEWLETLGIEWNLKNNIGWTILHAAVAGENLDALEHFIDRVANINATDIHGNSPLLHAGKHARSNFVKISQLLVEKKADITIRNLVGNNVIFIAVENGKSVNELEFLVNIGVNWREQNFTGDSILHVAVKAQNCAALRYFVSKGADISAVNNNQLTPWWMAVLNKTIKKIFLKSMVEHKFLPNSVNNEGDNALFVWLKQKRSVEFLEFFISLGVTWKTTNNNGDSALHIAARFGNVESARYLISFGANVNARNSFGETPFMTAAKLCSENLYEILNLLEQNGADLNMVDNDGNNAFLIAVMTGRRKSELEYFVKFGVDLGAPNNHNVDIFQQLAIDGDLEMLEHLLNLDLNTN